MSRKRSVGGSSSSARANGLNNTSVFLPLTASDSVRAFLEGDESIESYTDFIQIQAADGNFALSTVDIGSSGIPTSTDKGGSGTSTFTGTYTAPTAVGDVVTSSSSDSSSSGSGTTSSGQSSSASAAASPAAASSSSAAQATASSGTSAAASSRQLGSGALLAGLSSLMAVVAGALLM